MLSVRRWSTGSRLAGATVHFVTAELDGGPIVVQRAVPVLDGDTDATVAARILVEEHRAYPEAVRLVLSGGWRVEGRRVVRAAEARASVRTATSGGQLILIGT